MKVPESLHKAQRQYRHNYGSDELIPAFDFTETIKVVNELESKIEQLQNTSSNSDYAVAVKNLINSEVDCVQTKNGAYVNLDGVFDCLNRALHDFT